jgi:outer membrane receptor protein involved in Fe transport
MLKPTLLRVAFTVVATVLALAAQAAETSVQRIDIPAGDLAMALNLLAKQSGADLVYRPEQVQGVKTAGVRGKLSAEAALAKLLEGTSLKLNTDATGAMLIALPEAQRGRSSASVVEDEGRHFAQAAGPSVKPDGSDAQNVDGAGLEEIVVTAQKRIERLQDVPVPVATLNAETLVNSNQARLLDYYTRIPGLSVTPAGFQNAPLLSIRGLTTGSFGGAVPQPSVGVTVDDVPYGASSSFFGGFQAPDFDPSDLERIEVLRGPQGTLYGASSVGGLLKFVTVDPSTAGFSGRIQGGLSSVYNGDEAGYNLRGAINAPLSDTFAIRASAFTRLDPGYIDDPASGIDGVNKVDTHGGRVSALWRPSEVFALKLSALRQDVDGDGSSNIERQPGLGDLQHIEVPGFGAYTRKAQAYSATVNARLGGIDLTAVSGYNIDTSSASSDFSEIYGGISQGIFQVGGAALVNDDENKKFAQEVRLSMPLGQQFEWLIGGFYTHEKYSHAQSLISAAVDTGEVAGEAFKATLPGTFSELAVFSNLTMHFTERFDLQVGGRGSRIRQTSGPQVSGGPLFGNPDPPLVSPKTRTDEERPFTYLLTPRLRISPDLMVYARVASGYRPGGGGLSGTGTDFCVLIGTPCEYQSDKAQNYEIGIKGTALDRALTFDASLYYIDWKDIQVVLITPAPLSFSYIDNASRAKSQGAELSVESRPRAGFRIAAWVAWNDAQLTEDLPADQQSAGVSGDRLPFSSRFSGNISLDQEFPLMSTFTGFVGASVSYVGERKGPFTLSTAPGRQIFPAYAKTDLLAGVRHDTWTANLFVNNLTDKRAALSGGLGSTFPTSFNFIQPRTLGLTVAKMF